MVEIEIKLKVDNFFNTENLQFIDEKHILDIYFDTSNYDLLRTGNFLRNRNNKKIDFKLNIGDMSHTYCKETSFRYDNFVNSDDIHFIFRKLNMQYDPNYQNFNEFLLKNDMKSLAVIDKQRKTYKYDDLVISFDDVKDIGKFIEIEINLPDDTVFDKDEIVENMLSKIKNVTELNEYEKINIGYVELYLKKFSPSAFELGLFK